MKCDMKYAKLMLAADTELERMRELQEVLFDLTHETMSDVIRTLVDKEAASIQEIDLLFDVLLQCASAHYNDVDLYVDLTATLCQNGNELNKLSHLAECFRAKFVKLIPVVKMRSRKVPWYRFLYLCLVKFAATEQEIVEMIATFATQNPSAKMQICFMSLWFLPEIKRHDPDLFGKILKLRVHVRDVLGSVIPEFFKEEVDVETIGLMAKHVYLPGTIDYAIRNNDVRMVKEKIDTGIVNLDGSMKPAFFGSYILDLSGISLLNGACFFGSIDVVKFLVVNDATIGVGSDYSEHDSEGSSYYSDSDDADDDEYDDDDEPRVPRPRPIPIVPVQTGKEFSSGRLWEIGKNLGNLGTNKERTCYYAFASGNLEIVRLLEQRELTSDFADAAYISVMFHHYDLSDWIISSFEPKDSACHAIHVSLAAGFANNLQVMEYECCEETAFMVGAVYADNTLAVIPHLDKLSRALDRVVDAEAENLLHLLVEHLLAKDDFKERYDIDNILVSACKSGSLDMVKDIVEILQMMRNKGVPKGIGLIMPSFFHHMMPRRNEPLAVAADCGYTHIASYLIENRIIWENDVICQALRIATQKRNVEMIQYLLTLPSVIGNWNSRLEQDMVPYVRGAIIAGCTDMLRLFIKPPFVSIFRHANLVYAAGSGSDECMEIIMSIPDIDVNYVDDGKSALHMAITKGHVNCVKSLLSVSDIDVNIRGGKGMRPIHLAVENRMIDIIKLLLECPAIDINVVDDHGETPLHKAMKSIDTECLKLLLAVDACDPNIANNSETPLVFAIQHVNIPATRVLLECPKIDVNCRCGGKLPIHFASDTGEYDIMRALIMHPKISIMEKDLNGWTALHYAAYNGHCEIVKMIIAAAPAIVNEKTAAQYTALHFACMRKHRDCVEAILETEIADPNIQTEHGKTALHFAAMHSVVPCITALLNDKRTITDIYDNQGKTPLALAKRYGRYGALQAFGVDKYQCDDIDDVDCAAWRMPISSDLLTSSDLLISEED